MYQRVWKEIDPTWVNCASLDRRRKVMWQEELQQDLGAPSCCTEQTLPYCGGFECRILCNTKRSRHYTIDSQRFLLCALHCAGSGSQILLSLASLGADIYQDADTYSEEEEVSSAGLFCTMTSCRETAICMFLLLKSGLISLPIV